MKDFEEYEKEVIKRSEKIKFDGHIPFVGTSTPDAILNENYFKIMFNSIMHKIISHRNNTKLTYKEYEYYFDRYVKEERKGVSKSFYYDGDLVAIVDIEKHKGRNRYIVIPKDKEIIKEDAIFLKAYRVKNKK